MVSKRSEYQQRYRTCRQTQLKKNESAYKDHLSYRVNRREQEHSHTPISWDWDSPDTDSTEEAESGEELTLVLREEEGEAEEKREEDRTDDRTIEDKEKQGQWDDDDGDVLEKQEAEERKEQDYRTLQMELRKQAKEKLRKYSSKENKDCAGPSKLENKGDPKAAKSVPQPKKVDCKTFILKQSQPRKLVQQQRIRKRPGTAPVTRSKAVKADVPLQPVALYGCGNSERTTGDLWTHNVRAASSVYPAALRALKRKEADIRRRAEEEKKLPLKDKRKHALFNDVIMSRETGNWESEYQRNYPCYESSEYARPLSARLPRRAACFLHNV